MHSTDIFNIKKSFIINKNKFFYFDIQKLFKNFNVNIKKFPYCKRILIENISRNEKINNIDLSVTKKIIKSKNNNNIEILYYPTRVLMQDFTGVPAIADLVSMREALSKENYNPKLINPNIPVDLVIDHSVMVDSYGNNKSFSKNVELEFKRNYERYKFLKWGQFSFKNFSVVPPGTGICHQVNLEHISKTVWVKKILDKNYIFPDSLVGTDSHTTMVNALSVLGWGVGGIEAEAAMLGQPITMNLPKVIGVKLTGKLKDGVTATDLVLTITEILRRKGVVGKFVEFFGDGLKNITLADRATISNMAPEYGATCSFFPVDDETLRYLKLTGKHKEHLDLVKKYSKSQGFWHEENIVPDYFDIVKINLKDIETCLSGPTRPQDKIILNDVPKKFNELLNKRKTTDNINKGIVDGSVVIAAITSCTNTSNPHVLISAGLVAKKASEKGLKVKKWVKTSFAPGSRVVTEYLKKSGLLKYMEQLGFHVVGYGCTTCIGNSGPLKDTISKKINNDNLSVCSVLSGNRNFEGRVHPEVRANFLASPPLVILYALAGNIKINLNKSPIGKDKNNKDVYLKDLWPSNTEIQKIINLNLNSKIFRDKYKHVNKGDKHWSKIPIEKNPIYRWDISSTYVKEPPFFSDRNKHLSKDIEEARILVMLGDSITTDHISPAGVIQKDSPAGRYLLNRQISQEKFNSYGSRRGNHEVMMRGTFANIRLKNELVPKNEGNLTKYFGENRILPIYDAAMKYLKDQTDLIIVAGKEYGTGSSRDWAAKGTKLIGVKAVIAESFERIHRSNLIGMGVIPFEFTNNQNRKKLKLSGEEKFTIKNINLITPGKILRCKLTKPGFEKNINLLCRIDTNQELDYFKAGGILNYVIKEIIKKNKKIC